MAGRKIFSLFGSIVIRGMAKSKKDLTAFDKEVRATTRTLNKMAKDTQKLGKAITKNITAPLAVAATAATKFGADFDKAMTKSIAIMGDVSDTMRNDMEKVARETAIDLNLSAESMADAYFFLASAGLDAAESMAALPKVAAFAKAGNFDLAEATDLLTDAQSALGLQSEDNVEHMKNLIRVSDVLVKANTIANASVSQFSEAITNKAGAALRLLKKDVEEGAAVLAVYADQGVKGADAGTQLNIVLRDLQNASIKNKQGFQDAGIAVFDANGKMNNMADIVEDLSDRFLNMSDEQRRMELTTLGFTSKSVAATSALLGTSDAIREYEAALRGAAGITDEVAQKQLQTFWEQLGIVQKRLIDVGITVFKMLSPILMKVLIPALNAIVSAISKLVKWFDNLNPILKEAIAIFVGVMAVLGPILIMYGKFLPLIIKLVPLYKALVSGQLALNFAMSANPIGLIIIGIAALITAGVLLVRNWDAVKVAFFNTWDSILFHFENISDNIAIMYGSMILGILEGINQVGKFIPGMNKGLASLIDTVEKTIAFIHAEKAARKALHAEQVANNKLTKEESELVAEANKVVSDYTKAEDKNTKAKKGNSGATLEQIAAARKLAKDRAKFEQQWTDTLLKATGTRLQILEAEQKEALRQAEKLGADTTNIEAFYAAQRVKINADANKKQAADDKKLADAKKQRGFDLANATVNVVDQINAVWAASLDLRMNNIDAQAEREKLVIENSIMTNEEKSAAINEIDKEADAKKLEIQRENAAREKAMAIFSIILNTAMPITKALSLGMPEGLIFAVLVGALGVAQIAIAASQPMPFAEGGLVKSSPGGIVGQIGEGSQDELVLPMKTGARELANNIMGKLAKGGALTGGGAQMAMAGAREIHFHIGTLIADEFGVKSLAKRVNKYIVAENQRTGVTA